MGWLFSRGTRETPSAMDEVQQRLGDSNNAWQCLLRTKLLSQKLEIVQQSYFDRSVDIDLVAGGRDKNSKVTWEEAYGSLKMVIKS